MTDGGKSEYLQPDSGAEVADRTGYGTGVVREDGWHEDPQLFGYSLPNRPWTKWKVYLDGEYLGEAVDEAEGHRWIEDMRKMRTGTGSHVAQARNQVADPYRATEGLRLLPKGGHP